MTIMFKCYPSQQASKEEIEEFQESQIMTRLQSSDEVKKEQVAPTEIINIEPVKKKSFVEKINDELNKLEVLKDRISDFVWDNIL